MTRVRTMVPAMLLSVGLLAAGCAPVAPANQGSVPAVEQSAAAAAAARFTAAEYSFEGPATLPGGWAQIELVNAGQQPHDLTLVKLGEGKTLDDVMAWLGSPEGGLAIPEWVTMMGGVSAAPGESSTYWIDLTPGDYAYLSFSSDAEGVPDIAKGMLAALTVTSEESAVQPPAADIQIELVDFSFTMPDTLPSGETMFHFSNHGVEPHEMIVFRMADGAGVKEFMEAAMAEVQPEGEPPFQMVGVLPPVAAGAEAYVAMDLEPGSYVVSCFLPSPANEHAPHMALGMVRQVTVQ